MNETQKKQSELVEFSGDVGRVRITRAQLVETGYSFEEISQLLLQAASERGLEVFWLYQIENDVLHIKWRPKKEK